MSKSEKQLKAFKEALRGDYEIFINRAVQLLELMNEQEKEEARLTGYVPEEAVKSYNQFSDYPNVLTPKQISAMLGVPLSKAYELVHHHECPKNPRLKKTQVFKADFLAWFFSDSATHGELLKGGAYE